MPLTIVNDDPWIVQVTYFLMSPFWCVSSTLAHLKLVCRSYDSLYSWQHLQPVRPNKRSFHIIQADFSNAQASIGKHIETLSTTSNSRLSDAFVPEISTITFTSYSMRKWLPIQMKFAPVSKLALAVPLLIMIFTRILSLHFITNLPSAQTQTVSFPPLSKYGDAGRMQEQHAKAMLLLLLYFLLFFRFFRTFHVGLSLCLYRGGKDR